MNKSKNKKTPLSDEVICDVISKSIADIINTSENNDFKKRCYAILQENEDTLLLKHKLQENFLKFVNPSRKRSFLDAFFETAADTKDPVCMKSLIKDMTNVKEVNAIEELDGFDNWQVSNSENPNQ